MLASRAQKWGEEHIRRLAEVANFMTNAGLKLIASAAELGKSDVELIQTLVGVDNVRTLWPNGTRPENLPFDLHIPNEKKCKIWPVEPVKELLDQDCFELKTIALA